MKTKALEIRDSATFVPALATELSADNLAQSYLLGRSGYCTGKFILLTHLVRGRSQVDAYEWHDRTMHIAHKYISEHFDELEDGDVVDVEYILQESLKPKISERFNEFNDCF
jgi:hypothetical protein